MVIASILFALAAGGGIGLARLRIRERRLPPGLAALHGLFAAAGLVALLLDVLSGRTDVASIVALVLLGGAALGGFALVSFHVRGQSLPLPLMAAHALIAVVGYISLLIAAFFV